MERMKEKHVTHEPRLWLTLNPAEMRIASPTGTSYPHLSGDDSSGVPLYCDSPHAWLYIWLAS